ncbi:hypothetical protein ACPA9J_28035 [Pseudomonas aeruginosa]
MLPDAARLCLRQRQPVHPEPETDQSQCSPKWYRDYWRRNYSLTAPAASRGRAAGPEALGGQHSRCAWRGRTPTPLRRPGAGVRQVA